MLPLSGALQLKTSLAISERPICSARGAYSTFERPAPIGRPASSAPGGRNKFQRPSCAGLPLELLDDR